ncbi:MAG: dTDP-4-dehydrorhamnose 3,5-epimerase [Polyangiales bacterium]
MRFVALELPDAFVVELEPHLDDRGFFARTWCSREFAEAGLPAAIVQTNLSQTQARGALRGLHYQRPPSREGKVVRCLKGGIFDVIVDVRPDSPAFLRHVGVALTPTNRRALYIPPGFAHGFQTLEPDTEVWYQMTDYYQPGLGGGLRWNDPALGIEWPLEPTTMNERDATYPDLNRSELECFRGLR